MTGMGSTSWRPVSNSVPMPRQPKTVSVTTAPPSTPPKSKAHERGDRDQRVAKRVPDDDVRSVRPLARAVRT